MNKKQILKIGEKAFDFTLYDQYEKQFTLSNFKGKKILLSFHPLAWTSVCAKQMQLLEKNKKKFDNLNTLAFGVSVDSAPSKYAWAIKLKIKNTRLLADFWPHGRIAELYGIFNKKDGVSERSNIIINEDQKISFIKVYSRAELPDFKEIICLLEKIN